MIDVTKNAASVKLQSNALELLEVESWQLLTIYLFIQINEFDTDG